LHRVLHRVRRLAPVLLAGVGPAEAVPRLVIAVPLLGRPQVLGDRGLVLLLAVRLGALVGSGDRLVARLVRATGEHSEQRKGGDPDELHGATVERRGRVLKQIGALCRPASPTSRTAPDALASRRPTSGS